MQAAADSVPAPPVAPAATPPAPPSGHGLENAAADVLQRAVLGHTVQQWIYAGATAACILLLFYLVRPILFRLVRRLSRKTQTRLDDMAAELIKDIRWWWVLVIAIAAGAMFLTGVPAGGGQAELTRADLPHWLRVTVVAVTALQFLLFTRILVNYALDYMLRKNRQPDGTPDPAVQNSLGVMRFLIMLGLAIAIILVAMENLDIKVTPILTGLGIGGIAVALAVQNILGDVFASLTIVLDKPFQVGDAITVGDKSGTVERIGIKTTRLRATSGEELVFGNSDLLSSRVQNFKRMQERRVAFTLGVVYELPPEKLRSIPGLVKDAVQSASKVRFDRCHFSRFNAYSLDFECVYFVTTSDYLTYMDAQQVIYLAIVERFAGEGIAFAYPTQAQVQRQA
ncbi:MAG: mechanosensitive ion channel family protein [Phycisphaerales bacterium]